MSEENNKPLKEMVTEEVTKALDQRVAEYRTRFYYFMYGLGLLIIVLIAGGLLGGGDILRTLHNKAFPLYKEKYLTDIKSYRQEQCP